MERTNVVLRVPSCFRAPGLEAKITAKSQFLYLKAVQDRNYNIYFLAVRKERFLGHTKTPDVSPLGP